ncbi:MAG TPA: aspartate carbamoyltransferase [Chloroflexia bacterium]|nr:aspartate carbamoyltransferase [Chloroflexia bacterium]
MIAPLPERGAEQLALLRRQHILSVEQFSPALLQPLFAQAKECATRVAAGQSTNLLDGVVVANVFYEASTRTDLSFQAAVARLGGRSISTAGGVHYSSVTKGESLPDTVKTIACYADAIVLRHPVKGAAREAADVSDDLSETTQRVVPVINAGDGIGEHPTQALLDLYTIKDRFGAKLEGLRIGFTGDLRNGRTVHSLIKLLAIDGDRVQLVCIAPDTLAMPDEYVQFARSRGITVSETDDLLSAIGDLDVLYVTRVQKERFVSQHLEDFALRAFGARYEHLDGDTQTALRPVAEIQAARAYEKVSGNYVIDEMIMRLAKRDMILMHPLPRVTEIPASIDQDERAYYFRQVQNGMYIRMALLAAVLTR